MIHQHQYNINIRVQKGQQKEHGGELPKKLADFWASSGEAGAIYSLFCPPSGRQNFPVGLVRQPVSSANRNIK
jgi:hypothetical protein